MSNRVSSVATCRLSRDLSGHRHRRLRRVLLLVMSGSKQWSHERKGKEGVKSRLHSAEHWLRTKCLVQVSLPD